MNLEKTTKNSQQKKAIALLSGGLDSMLAAKMIMDQSIYVEGINFFTGFCGDRECSIGSRKNTTEEKFTATSTAKLLGIKLNIVDVSEDYKQVVIKPKYGYGAHLNPCLDCKIFMVKKAFAWMRKNNFDFIVTGEVVGQRPKSQLKHMLPMVIRDSGIDDILVRPLCAKHLAETLPEREGWIKRELLGNFNGRGRKAQIALAAEFGFTKYAQPSGGCCFLINADYTRRLCDLWEARSHKDYSLEDIALCKIGRHLRLNKNLKMIIGRREEENKFLENYCDRFTNIISLSHKGPMVLLDGAIKNEEDLNLALQITARYCSDVAPEALVQLQLTRVGTGAGMGVSKEVLNAKPFADEVKLRSLRI